MKSAILITVLFLSFGAFGATIEDVDFSEKITIDKTDLVLNGVGLRKVEKFGLPFKVYVAALYMKTKSKSESEILNDKGPRFLKMAFLRRVGGKDLAEAFETGHANNCKSEKSACDASKEVLKKLTNTMPDILNKGTMEFTFFPDKVSYLINGRETKSGTLEGKDISQNFLNIFIGANPPTEVLKKGLLGQ